MFDILRRKKEHDIEMLSNYRVLDKNIFMRKSCTKNEHQELVTDLFLILVNNPKQLFDARISLNIRYFESGSTKIL